MSETLKFKVYPHQVRSGDEDAEELGIREKFDSNDSGDWRNPDELVHLNGAIVQSGDDAYNAHTGAIVPDWDKGWRIVDPSGVGQVLFEGSGTPPYWVERALTEGRRLFGLIVLRDCQIHN